MKTTNQEVYSLDESSDRQWHAGMAIFYTLFVALVIALSGCHVITPRIVTTEIERTEHGFRIVSPKDTTIKGLKLAPDGSLSVDEYTATASPDALSAGSVEAANRSAAVGKLAEAAAALK